MRTWHVRHIDLLPEAQGRGWGARLMAALLAELAARGSNGIWIGLDNRNERARRFYTRLGFQPIEGAPDNYLGLRFENWRGPPFSTVEKLN
jgi:ribosomal protein S18 acetylase RimI-like enzyme